MATNSRIAPSLSSPAYLHLQSLSDALRPIAASYSGVLVDYGCGSKPYQSFFSGVQKYIGVDFDATGPDDFLLLPDGRLPLSDGIADVVLSSQVLEHVPDVSGHLAECLRVLKPGGTLILTTHGMWPYHTAVGIDDFKRWTLAGLSREVELAGFQPRMACGVCGGFLCLVQQALVLFDPFNTKNEIKGKIKRALHRAFVTVVNASCLLLKRLFPKTVEAGDIMPIAVVVCANKPL